jgi:hypothetical protein
LGRGSKNGPISSKTSSNKRQDTTLASCVFPPTVCWIKLLDNDAENGRHEKNDPRILEAPCNIHNHATVIRKQGKVIPNIKTVDPFFFENIISEFHIGSILEYFNIQKNVLYKFPH